MIHGERNFVAVAATATLSNYYQITFNSLTVGENRRCSTVERIYINDTNVHQQNVASQQLGVVVGAVYSLFP